jgi:hypothetical protein
VTDSFVRVTRKVHAVPAVVFDILATPHRHHEVDASGMVGADEEDSPITKAGQVFRMNMTGVEDGETVQYQVDNLVTAFEPNRVIAWTVAEADGKPLGWSWRYDLEPNGDHKADVTLTYDWTGMSDADRAEHGVPSFGADELTASLDLLAKVVKSS